MLISGKELANEVKDQVRERVEKLKETYGREPHLVLILVGDDPASRTYVAGKYNDANSVGFRVTRLHLSAATTEKDLLALIDRLNGDLTTDAILVQLPLPDHINEQKIINSINPHKDVDGFHPENIAALWQRREGYLPCTPRGIIRMLDWKGIEIDGKHAVVVGRGNIVGLPVSKLLLDRNATVTLTHSRTPDLGSLTRQADILIVAAGSIGLIHGDMIKPGAIVIDVGINRNPETGKLCGDVIFEECEKVAGMITPVPGGVGPMTKACLLENTVECFIDNENRNRNSSMMTI